MFAIRNQLLRGVIGVQKQRLGVRQLVSLPEWLKTNTIDTAVNNVADQFQSVYQVSDPTTLMYTPETMFEGLLRAAAPYIYRCNIHPSFLVDDRSIYSYTFKMKGSKKKRIVCEINNNRLIIYDGFNEIHRIKLPQRDLKNVEPYAKFDESSGDLTVFLSFKVLRGHLDLTKP